MLARQKVRGYRDNAGLMMMAILLTISFIILSLYPIFSNAQSITSDQFVKSLPTPRLRYSINGTTIIINNTFYNLILNARAGGIVFFQAVNDTGKKVTLLPADSNSRLLGLYLVTENNTLELLKNANLKVIFKSSDALMTQLTFTYKNYTIIQLLEFYRYTPFINTIIYSNSPYKLAVEIPTYYNTATIRVKTLYTYLYNNNLTTTVAIGNGTIPLPGMPLGLATAGLSVNGNSSQPLFVEAIKPAGSSLPEEMILNNTKINNTGVRNLYLVYTPDSNMTPIYLEVAPTNYLPGVMTTSPFPTLLSYIMNVNSYLSLVDNLQRLLNNIQTQINNYKNVINNYINKTKELQKELDTCKGQIDFYKQEMISAKTQLNEMNKRIEHVGRKEVGFFIIGTALGLVGGLFAIERKK